jgi:hypothetical protein
MNNLNHLIDKIEIWIVGSRYVLSDGEIKIDHNVPFDLIWQIARHYPVRDNKIIHPEGMFLFWSSITQVIERMNEAGYETPDHIKNQILMTMALK